MDTRNRGVSRKTSVEIVGVATEIRTEQAPITRQPIRCRHVCNSVMTGNGNMGRHIEAG